ncbi:MAG: hypothetical protein MK081_15720 [Flavobacteriales bacterium]|nr:hypothetical protein [Flavobacteriales bacterium]
MSKQLKTHDMIREAQSHLGSDASNKDIKDYCSANYGVSPISQTIYSAIGSEWSRSADRLSARELADSRAFVRTKFNGDSDKAVFAINMIERIR